MTHLTSDASAAFRPPAFWINFRQQIGTPTVLPPRFSNLLQWLTELRETVQCFPWLILWGMIKTTDKLKEQTLQECWGQDLLCGIELHHPLACGCVYHPEISKLHGQGYGWFITVPPAQLPFSEMGLHWKCQVMAGPGYCEVSRWPSGGASLE